MIIARVVDPWRAFAASAILSAGSVVMWLRPEGRGRERPPPPGPPDESSLSLAWLLSKKPPFLFVVEEEGLDDLVIGCQQD